MEDWDMCSLVEMRDRLEPHGVTHANTEACDLCALANEVREEIGSRLTCDAQEAMRQGTID